MYLDIFMKYEFILNYVMYLDHFMNYEFILIMLCIVVTLNSNSFKSSYVLQSFQTLFYPHPNYEFDKIENPITDTI